MQRLRAWFYLKNNKKRAAILVISFGLYFALVYGVRFFVNPMYYMEEVLMVRPAKEMQLVYLNQVGSLGVEYREELWEPETEGSYEEKVAEISRIAEEFRKKLLEETKDVDHIFVCNTYNFTISSFAGDVTLSAPLLKKDELETMLDYLKIEVVEGRRPEQPGEMVVDRKVLRNRGLSIGDTVYDKMTRIVGVVETEYYFAAGIDYEGEEYPDRYMVFLDRGTLPDLRAYFSAFGIDAGIERFSAIQIRSDEVNSKVQTEKDQKEIELPLAVMTYTISAVMGLTLYFVYRLHVQERYSEWCLYRSLGFSEKEVYFLALREYGICLGIGILEAIVICAAVCLAGGILMSQKGMVFRVIMPEVLMELFATGVLLSGIMQLPVLAAMRKVKTVDAMEEE